MNTEIHATAGWREPWVDRALIKVGVPDDAARIVGATPSVRLAWLLSAGAVVLFALWGPHADQRVLNVVVLLTPVLPVLGVAAAYGPWADPMFDVTQASPSSGLRVLLLRAMAVLFASGAVVGAASLALPDASALTIGWVLPALALCSSSLLLATFMPIARAAVLVIAGWLALVIAAEMSSLDADLVRGRLQLVFFAVTVISSALVVARRHHLDVANLRRRRSLLDAADAERRRIERNIHDGAQQQLVSIGVKANLVRLLITTDPDRAVGIIEEIRAEAQVALEDLRDMTRGAYPPILADHGLPTALAAKTRSIGVPADLHADGVGRLSEEIEIAAYYCCCEAMQNAVKHAKAATISVTLRAVAGTLDLRVADDGVGFEPAAARRGVGMRSMAERIESLGGTLEIRSIPGKGTTVEAVLPLPKVEITRA